MGRSDSNSRATFPPPSPPLAILITFGGRLPCTAPAVTGQTPTRVLPEQFLEAETERRAGDFPEVRRLGLKARLGWRWIYTGYLSESLPLFVGGEVIVVRVTAYTLSKHYLITPTPPRLFDSVKQIQLTNCVNV